MFFKQNKLLIIGLGLLLTTMITLKISNDNYYQSIARSSKSLKINNDYNLVLEEELLLRKKIRQKELEKQSETVKENAKAKIKSKKINKKSTISKAYSVGVENKQTTKQKGKNKQFKGRKKPIKLLTGLYTKQRLARLALDSYHAKGGKKGRLIIIKKYGKTLYQVSY